MSTKMIMIHFVAAVLLYNVAAVLLCNVAAEMLLYNVATVLLCKVAAAVSPGQVLKLSKRPVAAPLSTIVTHQSASCGCSRL